MQHKVHCAVCGKKGIVEVTIGQKIKSKEFCYFGKVNLNMHVGKYHYRIEFDQNNKKILKDKNGDIVTTRIPNPQYIKGSRRKMVEYWECKNCCGCKR